MDTITHKPLPQPIFTSLKLEPFELTKEQKTTVSTALKAARKLSKKTDEVVDFETILESGSKLWLAGKLGTPGMAALAAMAKNMELRANVPREMRAVVKRAVNASLEPCRPILIAKLDDAATQLRERCQALETREREDAAILGLSDDSFEPSPMLVKLRATHSQARTRANETEKIQVNLQHVEKELGDLI